MRPVLRPARACRLRCLLGAALAAGSAGRSRAVEITPLYGLQVLGGQYFFASEKGALSGNAAGHVAPAFKFGERLSLLPSLHSSYQGTKQVVDVVGTGSFFQEQMEHRLAAKVVWSPGGSQWRLKPSMSFKYNLLKETKDEEWSSGLFDYYTWKGGLEAEYVYHDPFSFRVGADYFETKYPNYTSLESAAAFSQAGVALARELVGNQILDTRNVMGNLAIDLPLFNRLAAEASATMLYQSFYNQPIVDDAGQNTALKRQDFLTILALGIKMPYEMNRDLRVLGSFDGSVAYNTSNQNSYDAIRTFYTPLYYNYGEVRVGPSLRLYVGPTRKPVILGLSGQYWYRRYPKRRIQNSQGGYEGASLQNNNWLAATTLTYPMAPHFALHFNFQYGRATSNMRFDQFYAYNYRLAGNFWPPSFVSNSGAGLRARPEVLGP